MKKQFLFFTLLLSVQVFGQTELLINGSFSNGSTGWTFFGSPQDFHIASLSCPGNAAPYLYLGTSSGGYKDNAEGDIYQDIVVPSNASSLNFSYKFSCNTYEITTTSQYDLFIVRVMDNTTSESLYQVNYSNLDAAPAPGCQPYGQHSFSINNASSRSGHTIRIMFQASTDIGKATVFRLDDVSLVAYPAVSCTGWTTIPTSAPYGSSGGSNTFAVNTSTGGCNFSAISNDSWINNITYPTQGNVGYHVDANSGNARSGTISIKDANQITQAIFTVNQSGTSGCSYSISPLDNTMVSVSGGSGFNINVTTGNTCSWTASVNGYSWITINSGSSGTGNGICQYSVTNNLNTNSRTGYITIAGQTFTITQAGTSIQAYTVSGTIVNNGNGVNGVFLTANPGNYTASTNSSGNYSFSLPSGWSGIITPSLTNYTFSPVNKSYSNLSANQSQNFTATSVSTPPTINSITFTNVIKDHPGIDEDFTLYSGSPAVTNNPIKICADGSTATYIKLNASNTTGINFRILDGNNEVINTATNFSSDPDKYGTLGAPYTFGGGNIEVAYTHPQYMDANGLSRPLKLEVLYNGNTINGISFPLEIYRAPIVFVHGFAGNRSTFEEMENTLLDNRLYPPSSALINRVDYFSTSLFNFMVNRKVVPAGINDEFQKARNGYYSAGKIILISHSMGGILSRLYLQGTYSDCPYRQDILKIITANTPHYGTQFANNGLTNIKLFEIALKIIYPETSIAIAGVNSVFLGAIKDMEVNSYPIMHELNIPLNQQHKVASVTLSSNQIGDNNGWAKAIRIIFKHALNGGHIYNGDINDLIVPLKSQQGGITLENPISKQWHVGSVANPSIIEQMIHLINTNPSSSLFTKDGFPAATLPPPSPFKTQTTNNTLKIQSTDSIKILGPVLGQTFNPNDNVNVKLFCSKSISHIGFIVAGNTFDPITIDTSNITNFSFQIPDSAKGIIKLIVLGGDSIKWFKQDTGYIIVSSSIVPDSIVINPKYVNLPLGLFQSIPVKGYFHGLNNAESLTSMPELLVDFDSIYLSYKGNGVFQGLKLGSTNVVYSYKTKSDTIHFTIYDNPNVLTSAFSYTSNKICVGDSISFNDQSLGLVKERKWNFPGGIPNISTELNPTIAYNTSGTYKVTLITTFENGTDSITIDSLIEINEKPTPNIAGANSICFGNSSILDAGSGYSQYLWSNGATTQTIKDSMSGPISVTVTNNNGCSASGTFNLIVKPLVIPAITISPISCIGNTVKFKSNIINGGTSPAFLWKIIGNGNSSLLTDSVLTVDNANNRTQVQCTLTSNAECPNPAQVVSTPVAISFPKVSISGNLIFCQNSFTTLTASGANTYQWNTGQNSPSINASAAGLYSVTGTSTSGCKDTASVRTFVLPIPAINLASTFFVNQGERIRLKPTVTGNAPLTYKWTPNYAMDNDTILAPIIQPHFSTKYTLTVRDKNGCSDSKSINVSVVGFFVYPNPTNGEVNIYGSNVDNGFYSIKILNTLGEIVHTENVQITSNNLNKKISIEQLPMGMYFISIEGNGIPYPFKILKTY